MHLLRVSVVRVQKLMLQVQRQLLLLTSRGWGGILSSRPYVHTINNCNVCTYNVILITRLIVRPTAKTHTPAGRQRASSNTRLFFGQTRLVVMPFGQARVDLFGDDL